MNAWVCLRRAGLASALFLVTTWAAAAPVVQWGSSWLLEVSRSSTFDFGRYALTFDGVAETFVHSPDGLVSMTVSESQTDLGAGRGAVDLTLDFVGGDPFAIDSLVALGFGVNSRQGAGDALDLTGPVELTAALVTWLDASGQIQSFDAMWDYRNLNAAANWNGSLFDVRNYLGGGTWNRAGVSQIKLHFETRALNPVSSPGSAALVGLGLMVLATRRRLLRPM
jgi:hypothetical protein